MKTKESDVLRACLEYLHARRYLVIRINNGAFKTSYGGYVRCTDTPGTADIIGVGKNGVALAVECKCNNGKQSEAQKNFENEWTGSGGLNVLARSIEDLQAVGL